MAGLSHVAGDLRQEKLVLLDAMLELTDEAAGTWSMGEVLNMLDARSQLIDRVSAIDTQLDLLDAGPVPQADQVRLSRCLEEIVALNERLLVQLSDRRDTLLNQMLSSPRLPS